MMEDTSNSWIANLKPGDDVIVVDIRSEKLSKVKSISPKLGLITLVNGIRFSKSGHETGSNTWGCWLREATPEAKRKLKENVIFRHYSRSIKDNLDKLIRAKTQGFVFSDKHLQKLTLIHLELQSLIQELSQ